MTSSVANTITQGILAKLLASENITVHVGNYSTAFFDVKNRILGLPSWNVDNKAVSDLLIGHEVGHALWTPANGIDEFKKNFPQIPFSIVNIVEDIRIERLIQDRYPGLISAFNQGYAEFLNKDFFKIQGTDVNSLGFANRLNIKAKLRGLVNVSFSPDETVLFNRALKAETFEDVLDIVKDIYELIKNNPEKQETEVKSVSPKGDDNSDESFDSDDLPDFGDEEKDSSSPTSEPADEPEADEKEADVIGETDDEPETEAPTAPTNKDSDEDEITDEKKYKSVEEELDSSSLDHLNDELKRLHTDFGSKVPTLMPSKEHINNCVVDYKSVMAGRAAHCDYNALFLNDASVKADWVSYKKSVKKHIDCLITDFERRKAAFQYSRSQVSDSGDIDTNRLHNYKFDDQIFRSITKLADAKNHGMMFFIDYSGSMAEDIFNVLDHTLNLVAFCNAVKIPYQVFGFTNNSYVPGIQRPTERSEIPHNQISLHDTCVFEILSSAMKPKELELAMQQIRAQVFHAKKYRYHSSISFASYYESMSGTPLNETLVIAHHLVAKFRAKYHVQKMNVIVLSDGDGQVWRMGFDRTSAENMTVSNERKLTYSVRLAGRDIELSSNSQKDYAVLVNNLRESLGCTMIGFFISGYKKNLQLSAINSIRNSYKNGMTSDKVGDWAAASVKAKTGNSLTKDKYMFIPEGFNFNCYFLINTHDLKINDQDSFDSKIESKELAGNISVTVQNKMAKEFTKFASAKKSSRVILNKFAEIIA